jgi:hypothetical protein
VTRISAAPSRGLVEAASATSSRASRGEPVERVDVQPGDRLGVLLGDLLDLDAALGREHAEVQLGRPVEGEARVVLLGDVRSVLDPDRRTTWPLMSRPRMLPACVRASSRSNAASFTPPALPRPPTCTWALTTTG